MRLEAEPNPLQIDRVLAAARENAIRLATAGDQADDSVAPHSIRCDQVTARVRAGRLADDAGTEIPHAGTGIPSGSATQGILLPDYLIIREIHRGGQGIVFQAVRQSTAEDVAIKVLHDRRAASPRELERFEREAEILRELNHPNLIAISEIGVAAGRPFLVMPYIAGWPLDEHVRRNGLSVRETLELFAKICEAVNAAHLNGVIHRDIKPSNIRIDDAGDPHVLDFGLAKITRPTPARGSQDETLASLTETGQFVGSLPWASPEQADPSLGRVDVRTDVYSLGAVLYQLLTGVLPIDPVGSQREVLNRIVTAEPLRCRVAASRSHGAVGRIDSDVETIVHKCLEKDRTRRYTNAGDLAADIRNYLAGRPLEARRDSRWYVLRKTLHRYRLPVAIAAAFLLLVVCGTVVATLFWRRAEDKATQAETIATFMEETLDGVDPFRRGGLDTQLLKKLMDEAAQRIRGGKLTLAPEAEFRLRVSIGRVYRRIAEFKAAHEMLDPAVDIARQLYPAESPQMAEVLNEIALVIAHEGDSLEALARFQNLKALLQRIHMGDSKRLADVQEMIIDCLRLLGRTDEALAAAHEGIEMHRRLSPPDPDGAVDHQLQLALVLLEMDRQGEAIPLFEAVIPSLRKRGDDPYVAWALDGLGNCVLELGRPEEAVPLIQEAADIMRRFYGGPHQQQVRTRLVESLRRSKRLVEAEQRAREFLALFDAHPEWDDRARRQTEWFLARTLDDAGRTDEAIESLRAFVKYGRGQSRAATRGVSMMMLTWMLLKQGAANAGEAESLARESLIVCQNPEFDHPALAWASFHAMSMLGEALSLQSRFSEAEQWLLDGYTGLRDAPGVPSFVTFEQDFKGDALRRIVRLYESWHTAEPARGHDAKAAEWRAYQSPH